MLKIKTVIIILIFFIYQNLSLPAQSVPETVLSNFNKQYAGSEVLEWEVIEQKCKVAFFTNDNFYAEAVYLRAGEWVSTSKQIGANELPEKVLKKWKKEYPNIRSVSAIMLVEKPQKKPMYHLSFETQSELVNLVFKKSGRLKEKITEPISTDD
ncbi:MAG TPA: PepSY-like domain-containing protein [Saprospiraceae bacterium]|nr:PepSY-like domain-containing protein [Saprospiraceae bacterium]